jgi:hypothetical protein
MVESGPVRKNVVTKSMRQLYTIGVYHSKKTKRAYKNAIEKILILFIYLFKFKVCRLELVFILQGATARPYELN